MLQFGETKKSKILPCGYCGWDNYISFLDSFVTIDIEIKLQVNANDSDIEKKQNKILIFEENCIDSKTISHDLPEKLTKKFNNYAAKCLFINPVAIIIGGANGWGPEKWIMLFNIKTNKLLFKNEVC